MSEEMFVIRDNETDERFGPFNRAATYQQAMARHIETGNIITISRVGARHGPIACCMDGDFLTEIEHDEEGNSIGAMKWFPDDDGFVDERTN